MPSIYSAPIVDKRRSSWFTRLHGLPKLLIKVDVQENFLNVRHAVRGRANVFITG